MDELIQNIIEPSSLSEDTMNSLHELGDLLRDDTNRIIIHDKLSILLPRFNQILSLTNQNQNQNQNQLLMNKLQLETLRVIINILANNNLNRDFFTNLTPKLSEINNKKDTHKDKEKGGEFDIDIIVNEFWSIIKTHLDNYMNKIDHHSDRIIEFIFILLNQFIYDTDHKSQYLEFFNSLKIQWEIYPLINEDNIGDIGEFLYELLSSSSSSSSSSNLLTETDRKFLSGKILLDIPINDLDEETALIIINLLSLNKPSNELYKKILQQIELYDTNESILIKRKLFVLASDLAPIYDDNNTTMIEQESALNISIDQLQSTNDPYVFSCCCITIGNFIHDKSSMEKALTILFDKLTTPTTSTSTGTGTGRRSIPLTIDKLISLYFEINKITDVVQIQSIHMWNNLMNETIANKILTILEDYLLKFTKIIIDNGKYYREILILYLKFIKKLIKLTKHKDSPPYKVLEYIFQNLDKDHNSNDILDIKYLLLQQGRRYTKEMFMELLKSLVHGVNTTSVLEQLKTIAIVNQQILNGELIVNNNDVVDELLVKNYFHPLENLLNQFISLLEDSKLQDNNNNNNNNNNNPNWEIKIFQNNLKFVAVSIIKIIEQDSNDLLTTTTELLNICRDIINAK